jgi:hypothetical protein
MAATSPKPGDVKIIWDRIGHMNMCPAAVVSKITIGKTATYPGPRTLKNWDLTAIRLCSR